MTDIIKEIEKSIDGRIPISFEYNKPGKTPGERVGDPHALYLHKTTGNMLLDVYQTSGISDSIKEFPDWRPFSVDYITNIKFHEDEAPFDIAPLYKPNSPQYIKVIKKV